MIATCPATRISAFCLYDASVVFPEDLRTAIRSPFRLGVHLDTPLIDMLSNAAHDGLRAKIPVDALFWATDLNAPLAAPDGRLPAFLVKTLLAVGNTDTRAAAAAAGTAALLCVSAFVVPNLVECTDMEVVRARVMHDVEHHIVDMPFLHRSITMGRDYATQSSLIDPRTAKLRLLDHLQTNIDVANAYRSGNGWPAAAKLLGACYDTACNELAEAVLFVRSRKP